MTQYSSILLSTVGGCPACDESVQPGHFACAPSSDWLLKKEEEGKAFRVYNSDSGRWEWYTEDASIPPEWGRFLRANYEG